MLAGLVQSSCKLFGRRTGRVRPVALNSLSLERLYRTGASVESTAQPSQGIASLPRQAQDLKAQILSQSAKITFRYDIDNHKSQTATYVRQAEAALGYKFKHKQLLRTAFVHTSASDTCNISLAWVGDAVLQLVVTEGLLSRYPEVSLGNLAILRAAMVNRTACLKNAQQLSLHRYLIVGKALERLLNPSRGQSFPYPGGTMSELFEAVMGAIYLDGGFVSTNDWFATAIGWPATFDEGIETYVRQHKHI